MFQTTLLSYYKTVSKEMTNEKIIKIIDAMCSSHLPEPDESFSKQIVEFVDYFKERNNNFYIHNQDCLVFKLYSEIIKKTIDKQQHLIHKQLPKELQDYAMEFSNKIFSLNIELICVVSACNKTYMKPSISLEELVSITEYLLLCKNAVILFYGKQKGKVYTFGFLLKNNIFSEIDAENLRKLSPQKNENYTTFSNLKSV